MAFLLSRQVWRCYWEKPYSAVSDETNGLRHSIVPRIFHIMWPCNSHPRRDGLVLQSILQVTGMDYTLLIIAMAGSQVFR